MTFTAFFLLPFVLVMVFAAVYDIKFRKVPNKLWRVGLFFQIPLTIMAWFLNPTWILSHVVVILLTFALTFLLSAAKVFGGADWKGLTFTSIAIPYAWYYNPAQGFIHPALDALVLSMLGCEVYTRVFRKPGAPLFALYTPLVLLAVGGYTAWSIVVGFF